jgi:hypothetical protein
MFHGIEVGILINLVWEYKFLKSVVLRLLVYKI